MVWYVVAPLIDALSAAYAGADGSTTASVHAPITLRLAVSDTPKRRPVRLVSAGMLPLLSTTRLASGPDRVGIVADDCRVPTRRGGISRTSGGNASSPSSSASDLCSRWASGNGYLAVC